VFSKLSSRIPEFELLNINYANGTKNKVTGVR